MATESYPARVGECPAMVTDESREGRVQTNTRIAVLGAVGAIGLAVGVPLAVATTPRSTELVEGTVVSVEPGIGSIEIRDDGGTAALRDRVVVIHLPAGQQIGLARGTEPLDRLSPGQRVAARVSSRTLVARWVVLAG